MDTADDDLDSLTADINAALDGELGGAPEETAEQKEAREYARDEAGRFAAKQAEEAAAAQPAQAQQPAAPAWKPVWYKDEYGPWDKLGEPLRNALKEREASFERHIQQIGPHANTWKQLEQRIAPYMQELAASGTQPVQYFEQLHAANEYLRTDPVAAIQWLAESAGVDLVALADHIAGQGEAEPVPPQVQALQQKIHELEQRLGGVTQFQQSTQQQQREAEEAQLRSTVETFFQGKPQGDREKVQPIMANLLRSQQATDLEDAYKQACWLHPDIRERILEDQRRSNVNRARAAAVSPRNAPLSNGRAASSPQTSIEDTVRSLIDGGAV